MVRLIALLALIGLSTPTLAEELDHANGYNGHGLTFGGCMYQCQFSPNPLHCQMVTCANLTGHPGITAADYYGPTCAAMGGTKPGWYGCPGGTSRTSALDGICCVPQLVYNPYPVAFPGFGTGPSCNPYAHAACVTQYNCPNHPESQGCYTFCSIQSGC